MSDSQFIMDDVKLLFGDLTTPEASVKFTPPQRANLATIQGKINPPAITWTWADEVTRQAQPVAHDDVGKYGLQSDINVLFQLTSMAPLVWQPVQTGTTTTWTWANIAARTAQTVTPDDVGKIGIQTDINTLYQLTNANPPVWQPVPNPTNTSSPLELSTGAADADSYHDFFRLQIAFEDVWAELFDQGIRRTGEQLYAQWDALMDQSADFDDTGATDRLKTFDAPPATPITGVDELTNFLANLKLQLGIGSGGGADTPSEITQLQNALSQTLEGCNMLLLELNRLGTGHGWTGDDWLNDTSATYPDQDFEPNDLAAFPGTQRRDIFNNILNGLQSLSVPTQDVTFPDLTKLLNALDGMLKEKYRFDVFAPDSINYGLLLNYRQHWQPQSYQVGNLVSTIPLAPQEIRRYTTKTVVRKTRNIKEIDESLRSGKDESSTTWRVDSEIVDRAKNQTNFQKNASGSFGNDNLYKVSAGMQQGQDQAVESAQTKREFHEAVVKSAQEYRNEHRMEITTEESREDEISTYREIRNPNDELTVTYLFYELQRRYLVDEALHKVTPVILVANEVPAPHEVDEGWILRHDWIIKRAILDDSFVPALDYLSSDYTGEELTLQVLGLEVEQQKMVVDKISQQVQLATAALDTATVGLEKSETQEVLDLQTAESMSIVKSFFDPLGITKSGGDGNSDRARVDFAKDAMNRAQQKVDKLLADLGKESSALQVAIDKYTKAATRHFGMLADIDRLRVHVKDNIIYYMQAIWTYEPADQRYFRLCNVDVPIFAHNTTVKFTETKGLAQIDDTRKTIAVAFPPPTLVDATLKLHQVADLENLIGFKGNYMIFPMVNFNYMTWFLMQEYLHIDDNTGITAQDPDPLAGMTLDQLKSAMATVYARDPGSFEGKQPIFEEIMLRLLSQKDPEMVIVPSNSLYIEALPGTHPLLEDFKLIHRAMDVKKVQAEVRHAELENLRLGARLVNSTLGDPDIDKVVVVGTGQNVTVDAGQ
ncbi:hypothetical protein [Burkholderia stagnalis]